ncbi:hypothetical protein M758_1G219200, partial [Ceratodon purpureus]
MYIIRLLCLVFNSPQEHNTYPRPIREQHGISDNLTKLSPQLTERQQAPPRSTTLSQLPFNHASLCTLITMETNDPPTNSTIIELSTLRIVGAHKHRAIALQESEPKLRRKHH